MAAETSVEGALSALRGQKRSDYLKVSTNKVLIAFLERNNKTKDLENVKFSDSVQKINKRGKEQERSLVITNLAIYNFLPGKYKNCQRAIPLDKLRGIALSRTSDELLFQVRNDYDYRFRIVRRAEVVEIISKHYEKVTSHKLKAAFADDLDKLQVTKEALKRRVTPEVHRESEPASLPSPAHSDTKSMLRERKGSESLIEEAAPVEGWLTKKGASNNVWRRRFFRLGGSTLRYYEARTKGSTEVNGGVVRPWNNNRYDLCVREALEPSTPDHLRNILENIERRAAFIKFCESVYSEENAKFYCAVEQFRSLPDAPDSLLLQHARDIVKQFVVNGAPQEISAPVHARSEMSRMLDSNEVDQDMFSGLQRLVLSIMRVDLLPQYLDVAKKLLATEDYKVKDALTEGDRKVEACTGCAAKFSLIKRRNFCQYCTKVYCGNCVSKSSEFPEEFGKKGMLMHVCDMCFGHLNPNVHANHKTEFAFTYASPQRSKPLNLAAENAEERDQWVRALRVVLEQRRLKAVDEQKTEEMGNTEIVHITHDASAALLRAPTPGIILPPNTPSTPITPRTPRHTHGHSASPLALPSPVPFESVQTLSLIENPLHIPASPLLSSTHSWDHDGAVDRSIAGSSYMGDDATSHTHDDTDDEESDAHPVPRRPFSARNMLRPVLFSPNEVHIEGWLWKEDPSTGSWRRRYFVLDSNRLWYYEMGLKGSIPITQGLGVHAKTTEPTITHDDATFGGFISQSDFSFRFNISDNDRVYQVAADTDNQLQYWMDALNRSTKLDVAPADEQKVVDDLALFAEAFNQEAPEGQVTFVFTDVQNSTKLWESEPDGMNEGLELHDMTLRELLKRFRGYEVKTEGDAFMVTFFSALDAILWCIAVQRELLKQNWPASLIKMTPACEEWPKDDTEHKLAPVFRGIRIRMGIHTGEPSCRRNPVTGRMDYFGPVVNRSARVADSAHGGQVICTQEVVDILKHAQQNGTFTENVVVDELGEFPYKGISTLVRVYQISPLDLVGRNPFPPLRAGKSE